MCVKKIVSGLCASLVSLHSLAETSTDVTESNNTLSQPASDALLPMLLALLFIVGIIFVIAWIAKKLNLTPNNAEHFKTVSSMSLGGRERIVIIEVQGKQHAIGVTPQSVNHLFTLEQNIVSKPINLTDNQIVNKINKLFGYQPPVASTLSQEISQEKSHEQPQEQSIKE